MSAEPTADGRYALVVDDNAHAALLASTVLTAHGWNVDCARDGFEAIVRFRDRPYDALLLDYRLPGMDGVQVLTWVRRNLASAPDVVVCSSECPVFLREKFEGLGVRAIVPKPATSADLWHALSAA